MNKLRIALIGAGRFGQNHRRVLTEKFGAQVDLAAVVDPNPEAAGRTQGDYRDLLNDKLDAAIIAAPTSLHEQIGCAFLESGADVLIEKPIAETLAGAQRLIDAAQRNGRILQVGHIERFNPAVEALLGEAKLPLFFEIHRMSTLSPRTLDIDVVLDLMVHDLEILLALTGAMPEEVRAAGVSVLSDKVDLANVRLAFPGGVIANLTASRVSIEQIRKMRVFQPNRYFSLDYAKQELFSVAVNAQKQFGFAPVEVNKRDALEAELADFVQAVRTRQAPRVTGEQGARALEVALDILAKIEEHSRVVARTVCDRQS
jgi:predicted dehydrogenase